MDTIEKALAKHRQTENAEELETPDVPHLQEAEGQQEKPQNVAPASVITQQGDARQRGVTTGYLEISFDNLRDIGAILPDDKRSKIKEEYKNIKRPLLQKATGESARLGKGNLIMVTSAHSGEGKTFSSLNLALSIAVERDCRVLLVDADVVKPRLGKTLGVKDEAGLVEYLNGDVKSLSDVLVSTNINNLTLLPAGKTHHLSHELLASNAMHELANEMASRYSDRIIIFDSPPLMATSEAKVLAQLVGQIVMVIEQDKTAQAAVRDALASVGTEKVSGLILNKSTVSRDGYYGYYYGEDQ